MKHISTQKVNKPMNLAVNYGLFACGILSDYRADWALANSFQQTENETKTNRRNPG